jgi:serine/threonine protein kinase
MIKGNLVGEGAYGKVYQATSTLNNKTRCVVKRNLMEEEVDFAGNIRELDLLLYLKNHPNIVQLHHILCGKAFHTHEGSTHQANDTQEGFTHKRMLSPVKAGYKDDILHFALEHADMDLHHYLYTCREPKALMGMMVDMLLGLEYMHALRIHHRDIKPSNFLLFKTIDDTYTVKLCDFGLSKRYTSQTPQTPDMCTSWYRAPEIVMGKDYNASIDVWALGCVFYEMWMRKPFVRCQGSKVSMLEELLKRLPKRLPKTQTSGLKKDFGVRLPRGRRKAFYNELFPTQETKTLFENEVGSSKTFASLVEIMLSFDPKKRPTVSNLLDRAFFKPYASFIQQSRETYLCKRPDPFDVPVSIVRSTEREWAINTAFYFYNEHLQRNLDGWYEHRILFQALDLYDRYLWYTFLHPKETSTEALKEKIDRQIQCEIQFLVCIYMAIKYFATLYTPISYKDISQELFEMEGTQEYAQSFEEQILEKVYQYRVYRPTIYEYADCRGMVLTSAQIRALLIGYGNLKDCKDRPLSSVFEDCLRNTEN